MEPSMQQFSYFAVTKGFHPRVYSSFEEANQQIINFPEPEYHGFNSLLLANNAFEERMFCIQCDKDAVAEQHEAMGIINPSPPTTPRTLPAGEGRLAPLVGGITWLPADVSASYPVALNNSMEKWLDRVCSNSSIPPACFFHEDVFVAEGGPLYRFNVCLPGNPVERGLQAKGRFSPIEDDTKDDPAFSMLRLLLQKTEREVRDFNFLRARRTSHVPFGYMLRYSEIGRLNSNILVPISQSAPRITENTLRDPGIQKAPEMVTRADPDCEERRFVATRQLWSSTDGILFWVRLHRGQGAVKINEIIVQRLNHVSGNYMWLVDNSDNCLELFLTLQGGHMSISTADLYRVQDLYRLDDNPGMGPYLLEDEDPLSDSSAGDMEDEFPDFFVMPETAIATYGNALSAADCTADKYEIPHYFANAMLHGGPPNTHWWVFIQPSDDAGPLKLWLRVHQRAHTSNPIHFLAGRGWKRIVRNNNLRQGDFIVFQVRSLNPRVLLLELP
ncbi:hypothetical protein PIB30_094355 [Stylosanthes scabra]|uniref:TF-B3 domain-containing protein n=1 Tax=Stylosanthes scabra TaxID=79078 RepID=A0ABU6QVL3_9FABA|nr:hypothetical protein [Stylosanthes scabra]